MGRRRGGTGGAGRPSVKLPAEPTRPRDLHVGVAARPVGRGGPPGHAGRRAGGRVGRRRRCRRRCGVADGGVGTQPRRGGHRPPRPGMAAAQRAALPDVPTTTSSARRTASATTASTSTSAATPGWPPPAPHWPLAGVGLVLDFVPNHVAPDHAWVTEHPEYFVRGTAEDLAPIRQLPRRRRRRHRPWPRPVLPAVAGGRCSSTRRCRRCGRPRPRTSPRSPSAATACAATWRCSMLDDVFVRTWGDRAAGGPSPDGGRGLLADGDRRRCGRATRTWCSGPRRTGTSSRCSSSRASTPATTSGSTTGSCTREPASSIRAHLGADAGYQAHTVRFVENHDEPRLAATLPPTRGDGAAAVVALTLPGVALLHEGQADGRRVRVPVTLGRRPDEPLDAELGRGMAGARRARRRPASRRVGARRRRRLARQPLVRAPRRLDVDRRRIHATSSSSTSPTGGRRAGPPRRVRPARSS